MIPNNRSNDLRFFMVNPNKIATPLCEKARMAFSFEEVLIFNQHFFT
jgi:hypothetical protein